MMLSLFLKDLKYPKNRVHILNKAALGCGPTAKEVLHKIASLKKTCRLQPIDIFIFYYAGHAVRADGMLKFCTKGPWLTHQEILTAVTNIGLKRALYILDLCESGKFDAVKDSPGPRAKLPYAFDGADVMAFMRGGPKGNLVMTPLTARQLAPGRGAFTFMFVKACQLIVRKQIALKKKRSSESTLMCVRALSLFDQLAAIWKKQYPSVPVPVIPTSHRLGQIPIGPLEEV